MLARMARTWTREPREPVARVEELHDARARRGDEGDGAIANCSHVALGKRLELGEQIAAQRIGRVVPRVQWRQALIGLKAE